MKREQLYVYRWGTNEKQRDMKGRVCRVQRRMKLNNCMIEFIDNHQQEIVSRWALRKVKREAN